MGKFLLVLYEILDKIEPILLVHLLFGNHRHLSNEVFGTLVLPLDAVLDPGHGGLLLIPTFRLPLVLLLDQLVQPARPLTHAADVQGELSVNL